MNRYAWLGFWIFLSVFIACDTYLFNQGYETWFHTAKTDIEKEIQQLKLDKLRKETKS